jgi:Mrp family chromosome partitioning ATPase
MRQIADAAHSVHRIRTMLQMGLPTKGRGVYMVTSACAGEGKTNLTVALGLSYVAAGCKTLVVDCDLVGQGITRGFRAEGTSGLREALETGSARGFVKKLPQGLRLLTAGDADSLSGWTLSSAATVRMLTEVRRYYDVVLIDTGPILGSVEAAVLAPAVDGVILTISRGQQKALVDRALNHLVSLGAEPVGFVFNRAQSNDFKHTSYSSSSGQKFTSRSSNLPEPRIAEASEVAAFGPLVRSVATFMRVPGNADAD